MSRDKILAVLRENQPELVPLPAAMPLARVEILELQAKFKAMAEGIGSTVHLVDEFASIEPLIAARFSGEKRIVSTVKELVSAVIPAFELHPDPHSYADVDVAIFKSSIGVAENSALWLTEDQMGTRVLPFITQHMVMIVPLSALVPDMHTAYQKIGEAGYDFGTFIAGPSKTADIEQSLVLGAHGPRSMDIFIYA
ncbi:lactate utilization protein C [Pedobacter cryoconitis]|uniref:LutC/YkgG family protein n=1 Tax=Pedobacter cryoconitis TaxID=188932 RepID=UPI0016215066|nr:LUD domain-containing protein [Pedobacter cryoconitis]MBB5648671.1 L-lactate dehydrogenase complex protein LldG [Pedobacter cryoconitis]